MASERIQRQIDRLLDEAEVALSQGSWELVRELSERVIVIDPENGEAHQFLATAERGLSGASASSATPLIPTPC